MQRLAPPLALCLALLALAAAGPATRPATRPAKPERPGPLPVLLDWNYQESPPADLPRVYRPANASTWGASDADLRALADDAARSGALFVANWEIVTELTPEADARATFREQRRVIDFLHARQPGLRVTSFGAFPLVKRGDWREPATQAAWRERLRWAGEERLIEAMDAVCIPAYVWNGGHARWLAELDSDLEAVRAVAPNKSVYLYLRGRQMGTGQAWVAPDVFAAQVRRCRELYEAGDIAGIVVFAGWLDTDETHAGGPEKLADDPDGRWSLEVLRAASTR
jgi:hypothetical protein